MASMNIILGGTRGLGEELAKQLGIQGKETFVIGRSHDKALHRPGMAADLTKIDDVEKVIARIRELSVESFFWVAGYGYVGDFSKQPDVLDMAYSNFAHALPIAQAAWHQLATVKSSKFVVISSTSGIKARTNEAVYVATKHAQVGFTRSLGLEAGRLALPTKVALFLPGGMKTPFWDGSRPDTYDSFLDPAKVASEIIKDTDAQASNYYERTIDRGSL